MYAKFYEDWFRHSKADSGGDTHTHRQHGVSLLSFLKIRKLC
jgi:hypothetical protein